MKALLASSAGRTALGLVAPALFLAWWQWRANAGGLSSVAFAPLSSVAAAFVELVRGGSLFYDMAATLSRSLSGLVIGGSLGVTVGIAMAVWRPLDRLFNPLLQAIRQVPLVGWLPLFGLWFGTGEESELVVVCLSAFFPTLLNSYEGVAHVDRKFVEVGRVYCLTHGQRFRLILLPAALPLILTGLTQGLAFAWIGALASEILLGVGGGLGVTMQVAQTQQRLDIILVTIIATAVLGYASNHLFLRLRARLLRWQPVAR